MRLTGENTEKRYSAWVNNKVMALMLAIQSNKTRDSRSILKHEFFLEEIEHHFVDCHANSKVWRAFSYLKRYLRTYPQGTANHQKTALRMLRLIYEELGFQGTRIVENDFKKMQNVMQQKVEISEIMLTPVA